MSEILRADKRMRERIDLCKRALETADFPQYKILCIWTLGGCFGECGDAVSKREEMIKLLEILDSDRSIIYKQPSLQEVMEDMYISACASMGQYAISYSEYETYMHKIKEIRPFTELQKGQIELIENLKNEGRDWAYNIKALVQNYQTDNRFGDAASLYSLLLIYRRQLRVSRDDINMSIHNYTANILNFVSECMFYCEQKRHPVNPYNYLFILEKAIDTVSEFQKDMSTQKDANEVIENLSVLKNHFEERQRKNAKIYYSYNKNEYLSPKQLEKEIRKNESIRKILLPPGCRLATEAEQNAAVYSSIVYLILSGICLYLAISDKYVHWGENMDSPWIKTSIFILAFVCVLCAFFHYILRKIKRLK
jgi:hypothetical protein